MTEPKRYLLWPDGAPLSKGDTPADIPDFTLFMPDTPSDKPRGLVIVLPGGGYHFKADHEGAPIAKWLNASGIPAAVVQYRVSPYRYPVPGEDARRAIRFARAHAAEWNVMPDHIAILGFSAGGHCAATAATIHDSVWLNPDDPVDKFSSRPDAAILCYAVINLRHFTHQGSRECLLKDDNGKVCETQAAYLSLENRVTPNTPPTFLWTTFADNLVPVQNTMAFANALAANNVPFELHVFPNGYHGLGLGGDNTSVRQWNQLCAKWLLDQNF